MLAEAEIIEGLGSIIRSETKVQDPTLDGGKRLDEVGLDSLDRIRVVIAIERQYGLEVDEKTAMGLHTVGDLVALVQSRGQEQNHAN